MSKFHQNVLAIIHGKLDLTGLKGKEITAAKRESVIENGGQKAIDAAATLVEAGVTAEWLCPEGRLAVDSLAAVETLISQGADIAKMQEFSPSQILAGLSPEQIASVMPVVEAPVAEIVIETVVVAPVVETKPEAPKAEVKVETKKTEMAKCSYSCKLFPVTELVVPKGDIIRSMLKLPENAPLTREQILGAAKHPRFVSAAQERNYFWLTTALELHAEAMIKDKKVAEAEAKKEADLQLYFDFCKTVNFGEVKEWKGKDRRKCNVCKHVHLASESRFPPLGLIKFETPMKDKDGNIRTDKEGNEILLTPTAEAATRRFTTCSKCQTKHDNVTTDEWMTLEQMTSVIELELTTEIATRESDRKDWERRNKQRNQGRSNNGRYDMSALDDCNGRELLVDGVYTDDRPTNNGPRNGGSRNDKRRRDHEDHGSHSELAESMIGG